VSSLFGCIAGEYPYAKIVSFEPFSDGLGLVRDAAIAKPQIFVTGDGWFTYNLVTNLSRIHSTID